MKYLFLLLLLSPFVSAQNNLITDSLENRLSTLHGQERFEPLYQLAKIYSRTNPEKSLNYAQESYQLADSLKNDSLIISSLNALAIINFYLGENFEGLKYQNRMIAMLEKKIIEDPESMYLKRKISSAYNNAGTILGDLGEREEAIEKFFQAEKYASELLETMPEDDDLFDLKISLFNNIGLLFYHTGNPVKGLEFIKDALELSEQSKNYEKIALSLNNLGLVQISQNQLKEAQANYIRALDINLKLEDSITIGGNYHNMGWIYEKKMQYDSALFYYDKSLAISKRMSYPFGISNTLCNIGSIYIEMGNLNRAEKTLTLSLNIAITAGILELQEKAYKRFYELYQKKGDYKIANEYQNKYHQTSDSSFNLQSNNQLAYWQIRYETEKKDKEILGLHKNMEIKDLKIARKNGMIWSLVAIAVIVLIFSVLLGIQLKRKLSAYKNLVKKNIEVIEKEKVMDQSLEKLKKGSDLPETSEQDQPAELIEKLKEYIQKEKPYLYSNINLDDLAKKLDTNRSYLSKAINDHFGYNFNAFINTLRIKECIKLFSDKKYNHLSLEGIGQMAGYHSRISFYNNFKKATGVTPSYFRNEATKK